MTVRARKVLETPTGWSHFCKRGRRGNARTIADAVVGANPEREIALVYPVTTEIPADHPDYAAALGPFYEEAAARLLAGDRGGPHRRGAVRGRPVLLRLLHASLAAAQGPRADRGRARRHRHVGRLDPRGRADHLGRRRAHRRARHAAGGRADAAPRRHRCRRGHEARAQPAEGPRGAAGGRAPGARDLCRARHHGGASDHPAAAKCPTTRRPTSRSSSCRAKGGAYDGPRSPSSASAPAIRAG